MSSLMLGLAGDPEAAAAFTALRAAVRIESSPRGRVAELVTEGAMACFRGEFSGALEPLEEAEAIARTAPIGGAYGMRARGLYMRMNALFWIGRPGDAARDLPDLLARVDERGDLFGATWLRLIAAWTRCAEDRPAEARGVIEDAFARWTRRETVQDWWRLNNDVGVAAYEGDAAEAERVWSRRGKSWWILRRFGADSLAQYAWAECRVSLLRAGAVGPGSTRSEALERAAARAEEIEGVELPWARGLGAALSGAVASWRGDLDEAVGRLATAERRAERAGIEWLVAATRLGRGRITGGDEGAALVASADAWARSQAIVRPDRFARMYVPGAWDAELGGGS
jgi:hypothetical protein